MDDFKKASAVGYTAFDLNCRHCVPHTPARNKVEKILRRKARGKLKKDLTNQQVYDIIVTEREVR